MHQCLHEKKHWKEKYQIATIVYGRKVVKEIEDDLFLMIMCYTFFLHQNKHAGK